MRSYPVKENPIGWAVSEILRYKHTHKLTGILLLYFKDLFYWYYDIYVHSCPCSMNFPKNYPPIPLSVPTVPIAGQMRFFVNTHLWLKYLVQVFVFQLKLNSENIYYVCLSICLLLTPFVYIFLKAKLFYN